MNFSFISSKKYFLIVLILICKCSVAQYISSKEEITKIAYMSYHDLNINILPTDNPLLFQITVNNPECQPLEVQLKNDESKTFQDAIFYAKEYYTLELNTSQLEDGDYSMSIKNSSESYSWELTIETVGITSKQKEMVLQREIIFNKEEFTRSKPRLNYYVKSNYH